MSFKTLKQGGRPIDAITCMFKWSDSQILVSNLATSFLDMFYSYNKSFMHWFQQYINSFLSLSKTVQLATSPLIFKKYLPQSKLLHFLE